MRSRVVLLLLPIFVVINLYAQPNRYGVPFYQNYSVELSGAAEYNHAITKDNNGILYIGNDTRGVIRYDGAEWTLIPVRNERTVYTIGSDKNNVIYLGGSYEFGYISPQPHGEMVYTSLAERVETIDTLDIRYVFSHLVLDERILFFANRLIFSYYPESDSLTFVSAEDMGYRNLLRAFKFDERVFVSDNIEGLLEYRGDSLVPLPENDFLALKRAMVILPFSDEEILIGTEMDGLFIYNMMTGSVEESYFDHSLNERLKYAQIYRGTWIDEDHFAIGTLSGEGVMVISRSGELVAQYNSQTLDIDNDVITGLYCDYDNGGELWICTVGFFTRINSFNDPFTRFSRQQGVVNGVNRIADFNDAIYIGHDNGVSKVLTNSMGLPVFADLPGIAHYTPSLLVFSHGNEEFLIAGTQNGGYVIDKTGKVYSIDAISGINLGDVRSLMQREADRSILCIGSQGRLIILRYHGNGRWEFVSKEEDFQGHITEMVETADGRLWFSTNVENRVHAMTTEGTDTTWYEYDSSRGLPDTQVGRLKLNNIDRELIVATPKGLIAYDHNTDSFISADERFYDFTRNKEITRLLKDSDGDVWISFKEEDNPAQAFEAYMPANDSVENYIIEPFNALPNAPAWDIYEAQNRIWMAKSKNVFVVDKKKLKLPQPEMSVFLNRIVVGSDSVFMNHTFTMPAEDGKYIPVLHQNDNHSAVFPYRLNQIRFSWSTNYFADDGETEYSYYLKDFDRGWSNWESLGYKEYGNLRYGHYRFMIKARTVDGIESEPSVFEFVIKRPWYATGLAIAIYVMAGIGLVILIIYLYTRRLRNENIRLEGIVAERTAVVVKQKEELESSIHYASRIQMALLPSEELLSKAVKEYFILFKPRDIVSGDFYWMSRRNGKLFVVAADCTGHGVPGAFMSLLGMSFLDEIVNKSDIQRADLILNELRAYVTNSLKQVGDDDEAKDGMDLALMVIDFERDMIEFSGAYNPCFRVRALTQKEKAEYDSGSFDVGEGEMTDGVSLLQTVNASKMPIGISGKMNQDFELHQWSSKEKYSYYIFSDGYVDQFGVNGRKFMKKNFKKLLLAVQQYPLKKQGEVLDQTLLEWMGSTAQIDDIIVVGFCL